MGEIVTPHDAPKEHHFMRDSRIWPEGQGMSTSFHDRGMDRHRAPITETATWNGFRILTMTCFGAEVVLALARHLIVAPLQSVARIQEVRGICSLMMKKRIFRIKVDCPPIPTIRQMVQNDRVILAANLSSRNFRQSPKCAHPGRMCLERRFT